MIKNVCIVGGGTSGWWTAGYLQKKHPELHITLIESPKIPTSGVGESTMPNVRNFFEELDIKEEDWIASCSGVRKQGNVKTNFSYVGDDPYNFMFIHKGFDEWFDKYNKGEVDKYSCYDLYDPNEWRGFAYHIDAAQSWQIVKEHTENVTHILKEISSVDELPPADLYIDCSGLRRILTKDRAHHSYPDTLTNTCVVRRVKGETKYHSETIGRDYGWQFNVYLSDGRIGCGYVFSDKHISIEQAKEEWMKHNGHKEILTDWNILKWNPGRLVESWKDNVVAVGLSSGFIEPMEANGLSLLVNQIRTLSRVLHKNNASKLYNRHVNKVHDEVADFIWHHYACTSRNDTDFWKHYAKIDGKTSLWKRIKEKTKLEPYLYPSYVYAYLAIYYGLKNDS